MKLEELNNLYYIKKLLAMQGKASVQSKYKREIARLEAYIENIKDCQTRLIFTLRFVKGLNWKQVANRIGGGNTEDSVKQICYRYLKRK